MFNNIPVFLGITCMSMLIFLCGIYLLIYAFIQENCFYVSQQGTVSHDDVSDHGNITAARNLHKSVTQHIYIYITKICRLEPSTSALGFWVYFISWCLFLLSGCLQTCDSLNVPYRWA